MLEDRLGGGAGGKEKVAFSFVENAWFFPFLPIFISFE